MYRNEANWKSLYYFGPVAYHWRSNTFKIASWPFWSYKERKDFRLIMSNENLAIMHINNFIWHTLSNKGMCQMFVTSWISANKIKVTLLLHDAHLIYFKKLLSRQHFYQNMTKLCELHFHMFFKWLPKSTEQTIYTATISIERFRGGTEWKYRYKLCSIPVYCDMPKYQAWVQVPSIGEEYKDLCHKNDMCTGYSEGWNKISDTFTKHLDYCRWKMTHSQN
jgi:hypothetical protein